MHGTLNSQSHYIKYVGVTIDGTLMFTQNFKSQLNRSEQDVVVFSPDLKTGATIEVNANCNWFGDMTRKITL
jgi:hypothetical protein